MKRLVLIRHARSVANNDEAIYLQPDKFDHTIELSADGMMATKTSGSELNSWTAEQDYTVFISPLLRACQTWQGMREKVNRQPAKTLVDGRLREQEFKAFKDSEDMKAKKVRRSLRGKLYYRFKNGESGFDVLDRVSGFYNQLRTDWLLKTRTDTVVIISHEITMRCFMLLALEWAPERFENLWFENLEQVVLEAGDDLQFRLITKDRWQEC
jgi:broad specificity phosphatase PhoE